MAKPVAIPLTVTVLLHLAVVLLLAFNLTFSSTPQVVPPQPKIIEAKLVSMEQLPALRAQPKPITQAEPKPVDTPQPEPEKPEPVKVEPPKPQPKPEPPQPDLEKQKQIEKQKLLEKEKTEAEQKKLAEQKKQEDERRRKAAEEAQRKAQDDAARKQREQQEKNELAKAMAAEDSATAAEMNREAVASYSAMMIRDIESNWNRPPSARLGMKVILQIRLIKAGDVIDVAVSKSSGDDAFDRAAVAAVRRVGKFPYLSQMSDSAFNQNFRPLTVEFSPTDLRQ